MLLPWGTDAPLYHWPIATGVLVATNLLVFFGQLAGVVDAQQWALAVGDGLHPPQWLTSHFLHAGVGPLIGNMLFLWAFGLVVEGKVGWWRMLSIYLLVGTLSGAALQVLGLGLDEERTVMGASACVLGLMAVCLVWAPLNEITCHMAFWSLRGVGSFSWDAPIYLLAILYVGLEVVWVGVAGLAGLGMVQGLGQVGGAVCGFLIGTLFLKRGWVDCENWDMFTRLKKRAALGAQWERRGRDLERKKRAAPHKARIVEEIPANADDPATAASRLVQTYVDEGEHDQAARAIDQAARTIAGWPLRSDLLTWISRMQQDEAIETSIPLMRMYCARYPEQADRVRLKLAQVYLATNKHQSAGRLLEEIDAVKLPPEVRKVYRSVEQRVRALQAEGAYEIED